MIIKDPFIYKRSELNKLIGKCSKKDKQTYFPRQKINKHNFRLTNDEYYTDLTQCLSYIILYLVCKPVIYLLRVAEDPCKICKW